MEMARKLEYFADTAMQAFGPARYKVKAYQTAGVNFPVESNQTWATKAEAEAAAARVNAGDESGLTFGSYSDD
jgi:hypothetical protein